MFAYQFHYHVFVTAVYVSRNTAAAHILINIVCSPLHCYCRYSGLCGLSTVHRDMGAGNTKEKNKKTGDMSKDTVEAVVCNEKDIGENEMKSFDLADAGKVLVVKQKGQVYALGSKCTHYGAPLTTGVLADDHVRCPWHGACFNIKTGDIEDFPGLDCLPCFQVKVEANGDVKVSASRSDVASSKRVKKMATRDKGDNRRFVIIGGGCSALVCAETLRQDGFRGDIVMIAKEPALPYDRIKISKSLESDAAKIALRPAEFYKEKDITVMTATEVTALDTNKKVVQLSNGMTLTYDAVYIATGSSAQQPAMEGKDLNNVFVLRNINDAESITQVVDNNKQVVILGASFIGMEVAAFLVSKVKSVTVIGRDMVPFRKVFGEEIGRRLVEMFKEKGVNFKFGCSISKISPSMSNASSAGSAVLSDGTVLAADMVICGLGAVPNTVFLKGSGITVTDRGLIPVNEYLETNMMDVFAGGDIVNAPVLGTNGNIAHWQVAHYHGRVAARNMLGLKMKLRTVPFFWTMLFGKGFRYSGYVSHVDEVMVCGDLCGLTFMAYVLEGDQAKAIITCGKDPAAAKFAELLASGGQLSKEDIVKDPTAWMQ